MTAVALACHPTACKYTSSTAQPQLRGRFAVQSIIRDAAFALPSDMCRFCSGREKSRTQDLMSQLQQAHSLLYYPSQFPDPVQALADGAKAPAMVA